MRINGRKQASVGVFYLALGAAAFYLAHGYAMGTALSMGPGLFPALIGVVLMGVGAASILQGARANSPDPASSQALGPLLLILAGIISFALLIDWAGFLVAAAALLAFACARRLRTNPVEIILTYVVLVGFSAVVFIHFFDISMKLLPWS